MRIINTCTNCGSELNIYFYIRGRKIKLPGDTIECDRCGYKNKMPSDDDDEPDGWEGDLVNQ